jgi:transketolase
MVHKAHTPILISELVQTARELRIDSLKMIYDRGQGHPGGTLSAAEIMTALYFHQLNIDPSRPGWDQRDRFILSKGHASTVLYVALAKRGFFPVTELATWGKLGSRLQGHPDRLKTPGVDMSAGCPWATVSVSARACVLPAGSRGSTIEPMWWPVTANARRG